MTDFPQANLPDTSKEDLCRVLLAEFGVSAVKVREPAGELLFRCPMPWHEDRTPSAGLNYRKLTFNCFACGAHGGLLWFIAMCRGTTGHEARDWLDNQTGFNGETNLSTLLEQFDALYNKREKVLPPIPRMSESVLKPWELIHPYLTETRDVPVQNIIDLRVGYDPVDDRIVLPHFWKGSLVGWQSRRICANGSPKYLSTAEFPKDRTIYNYQKSLAVVVESPLSVLRHYHHQPIEATFGASVTPRQVDLLAAHSTVVLFMDNDEAGWIAVEGRYHEYPAKYKRAPKLEAPGLVRQLQDYCDVRVVDNPYAADAADMDDDTVDRLIASAIPYALWKRPDRLRCWVCSGTHDGRCI